MNDSTYLSLNSAFVLASNIAPWAIAAVAMFVWGKNSTHPIRLFFAVVLVCWGIFGVIQSVAYFVNLALLSVWREMSIFYLTVWLNWLAALVALCISPFFARWFIRKVRHVLHQQAQPGVQAGLPKSAAAP
jgi:small neutral amino acid transporter SnatA (MarC family)